MARKPTKGYFVKGHFGAAGSELDLELKRELKGDTETSKTDLKKHSEHLQQLGEQLLGLRSGLLDRLALPGVLLDALAEARRISDFEGRRRQIQYVGKLMRRLDAVHPRYGFASHVGYITPTHTAAVRRHGPCPQHRLSFNAKAYAETADAA